MPKIKIADTAKVVEAVRLLNVAGLYPAEDKTVLVSIRGPVLRLATRAAGCQVLFKITGEVEGDDKAVVVVDRDTMSALYLGGKDVTISIEDGQLAVNSGRNRYRIPAVKGARVEVDKTEVEALPTLDAGVLLEAVRAIWFGHDEGGTGDIRFRLGRGQLLVETADVFRAAYRRHTLPTWKKVEPYTLVLTRKVIDAVLSAFDKDTPVSLLEVKNHAVIVSPEARVTVPCVLSSTMPDIVGQMQTMEQQVKRTVHCILNLEDVKNSIKGALAVSDTKVKKGKDNDVAMVFEAAGDKLTARVAGDRGRFSTTIRTTSMQGKGKFSTSPRYLKVMIGLASREKTEVALDVLGKQVVTLSLETKTTASKYAFVQVRE